MFGRGISRRRSLLAGEVLTWLRRDGLVDRARGIYLSFVLSGMLPFAGRINAEKQRQTITASDESKTS
jgi:hypothetical protein